jgi:hypothetical protein
MCFFMVYLAVDIATGYRLDDRGVEVRVPVNVILPVVQIGSGVHPASCPMGTEGDFLWGKAAGS